ncbi:IS5 family transposase [Paraburkholderia sp. JPY465]
MVEPFYPKRGNGRPPIALERMLRIHFVQHWFNLADLACEEALYDSLSLRRFVGIDLGSETVPDATTLLKFRHLLEEHKLGERIFAEVGAVLQARGAKLKSGTIVDATLIGELLSNLVYSGSGGNLRRRWRSSENVACQRHNQRTREGRTRPP